MCFLFVHHLLVDIDIIISYFLFIFYEVEQRRKVTIHICLMVAVLHDYFISQQIYQHFIKPNLTH